jgi:tRNA:m4X modification enzyme
MTKSNGCSSTFVPLPPGWTKCHAYLRRKSRFCSQEVVSGTDFCGHHATSRIPCPLDPSHRILANRLEKHLQVCPARTKQESLKKCLYFCENINRGSSNGSEGMNVMDATQQQEWARRVAQRVLEIHNRLFSPAESSEEIENISRSNIPLVDLSQGEFQQGLESSVQYHRIKTGGKHHMHQQASLIGHLRRMGAFDHDTSAVTTVLEMGAGRGILGLLVTGILLANRDNTVKFVMVERNGTRAKADNVLRSTADAKKEESGAPPCPSYMSLFHHEGRLTWERIPCDLAHVHVPTVLQQLEQEPNEGEAQISDPDSSKRQKVTRQQRILVVAKHLCGAGTDLALRSLREVRNIHACLFATCCHGVCSWNDYVGQNVLRREFQDIPFGANEFELLRRWSTGANHSTRGCHDDGHSKQEEEEGASEHKSVQDSGKDPLNVNSIVQSLQLQCGVQSLGRACQRLLDYGRCEYMREVVFHNEPGTHVEMVHYVSTDITLQNTVLLGCRTWDM